MHPPGRLTIDLDALRDNWRRLARETAPSACAAVVKANGYGLGVELAAAALFKAGCRIFFVAHAGEGVRARAALGREARIFVLNGFEAGAEVGDYAAAALAPVIGSAGELARWDRSLPFALHVDTGMNRLGFAPSELDPAKMGGAALLMSHFVSAENPDDPVNARQIAAFERARALFPGVPASLANSSGLFLPARPHYDLARPGYALYGGNPTPGRENPMRAVATLEVAVQQTRWIEPGETAGYNGRWTARRRTKLATLLAGYADGLPFGAGATDAAPGPEVRIAGRMCPLVGRMSMDLCIADVTYLPDSAVGPGTRAEFFGATAALDTFAAKSGTIGYQVLTGLGARYERIVRSGDPVSPDR
ncbi:MAG: alanine racemase [Pseudomonadota bacterium]|nr:alanine racemase [Pseudomonadota bacterium]